MTEAVVEGRARTVETAVDEIGEILIGKDPARINDHWQTMAVKMRPVDTIREHVRGRELL